MTEGATAVIVGAGIAGLATAQALSPHFAQILLLDPDKDLGSDQPRSGAPQGAHLHVLLERGLQVFAQLFPAAYAELTTRNCPRIDWADDTIWDRAQGRFPHYPSGVTTLSCTRPLLESLMAQAVVSTANVELRRGTAIGFTQESGRVVGVRLKDGTNVRGDLTVICGGAHYPIDDQLQSCGLPPTRLESRNLDLTYTSLRFDSDILLPIKGRQYYFQASPPISRVGGVVTPIEGGQVVATVIETGGEGAGGDFFAKAKRVGGNEFFNLVAGATPRSSVAMYRKPAMTRRHPVGTAGLVLLGDCLTSLSPVYGQGMTVALLQAELLGRMIGGTRGAVDAAALQTALSRVAANPWRLAALAARPSQSLEGRLFTGLLFGCQRSKTLHRQFLKTLHMRAT